MDIKGIKAQQQYNLSSHSPLFQVLFLHMQKSAPTLHDFIIYPHLPPSSSPHLRVRPTAASLTWTQIHRCVVWCCPGESDVGSCICHGPPSHSRRGSGHWGSFCSRLRLQPAPCSGTEREHKHTGNEILFPETLWETIQKPRPSHLTPALPSIPI